MTKGQKITLVDLQLPISYRKESHRIAREPIGILELGAFLRQETGAEVTYSIINSLTEDPSIILKTNPEKVGFSTYSYNYPLATILAKQIKNIDSTIKIAFGGPHAGAIPEQVMQENPGTIDAVIAKEGELGSIEFLQGKQGVIYAPKIPLSKLPKADRLEYLLNNPNFEILGYKSRRAAVVVTSRGCNRSCNFCNDRLSEHRLKPLANVMEEVNFLLNEYSVDTFIFEDPLFNGNLSYLENLCESLANKRKRKSFYSICMADFGLGKNPKIILDKMARAGFIQINWGIEDPRQEYRSNLDKKIKMHSEILKLAKERGISNRGLLMIPTNFFTKSPEQDVISYTQALIDLPLDAVKVNITTPYPGTPFYNKLHKEGKIIDPNWEHYDTNHLVFDAGKWTPESVSNSRDYIEQTFAASRGN